MKRFIVTALAVLWVSSAQTADAAKVGDKLYIKAKNTKVLNKPKSTAKVVAVLQPGQQVVWGGSVKQKKSWHNVAFDGQKGIVYRSTLSVRAPSMEMTRSGQQVDARAFASSGAATKALGAGAKTYGENNNLQGAVDAIEQLEALAKSIGTRTIAKHIRVYKLSPNVGANP
ncbi:MAG: SH3 domain-containing protein [Myxococcota bacterium]